ncbi:tetratricopeptide repeat protein [Minwuia sp.]|uniref:tetratricopeptide repeat protein n=1 Tax=Minwuia sp. TaxID=2493630 RepID=UPI003A90C722
MRRVTVSLCLLPLAIWTAAASDYDEQLLRQQCLNADSLYSEDMNLAYCRVLAEVTRDDTVAAEALKRMADIHRAAGIDFLADEIFDELVERQPQNLTARRWRAAFSLEQGRSEKAMADLNRILEEEPESKDAYIGRGLAKAETGDYQGAIDDVERALAIDPDYADAYRTRGDINYYHGYDEKALDDFDTAIDLAPDRADLRVARADFLRFIGKYARAYLGYKDVVARDPENVDARFNIGRLDYLIAEAPHELLAAAAYLKLVLVQDPRRDTAAFLLANALSRLEKPTESMKYHRVFLERSARFIADYKTFLSQEGYFDGEIDYKADDAFWTAVRACVDEKCRILPSLE